jgi:hypothetical protein
VRRLIRDEHDVSIVRSDSGNRPAAAIGSELPLGILHATVRESATLFRRMLAHDVVHILNRYYTQVGDAILANDRGWRSREHRRIRRRGQRTARHERPHHREVVETMAGQAFNLDVKLAWTAIYNFVAETMIEASV